MSSKTFKQQFPVEQRTKECERVVTLHPDRLPVICERGNLEIQAIDKKKFLVPRTLTVGEFLYILRKKIKLRPEQALYISINNCIMPAASQSLDALYSLYRDTDGFLYITYYGENTFGRIK